MIQRINDSAYNRKSPQQFIPRRDLFPDAEPSLSGKSTEDKKQSDRKPSKKESGKSSSTSAGEEAKPDIYSPNRIFPSFDWRVPVMAESEKSADPMDLRYGIHGILL